MGISAGHIVTFVRGPRARAVWFPFGVSLAGCTGLSVFPGPLGSLVLLISMLVILGWFDSDVIQDRRGHISSAYGLATMFT
jgi:hypothetical protein